MEDVIREIVLSQGRDVQPTPWPPRASRSTVELSSLPFLDLFPLKILPFPGLPLWPHG